MEVQGGFGGVVSVRMSDEQITSAVLGARKSRENALKDLEDRLTREIDAIGSACALTESQRQKLQLAGRGDTVQFFRRFDEMCREASTPMDRAKYVDLMSRASTLRLRLEVGLFGEYSFFRKTVRTLLTDEQRVPLRELELSRQREVIDKTLRMVQGNTGFRLGDERSRHIAQLLLEKADPPTYAGEYAPYIVLYNAAQLEEPLRKLMDEGEWDAFRARIALAQRVIPRIQQAGLLDTDEFANDRDE
jgi:hypothetical protein